MKINGERGTADIALGHRRRLGSNVNLSRLEQVERAADPVPLEDRGSWAKGGSYVVVSLSSFPPRSLFPSLPLQFV